MLLGRSRCWRWSRPEFAPLLESPDVSPTAPKAIRRALREVFVAPSAAASGYGTRIFAQQQTDLIFSLFYLLLCARYGLRGAVNQLLSLAHVQKRPDPALQLRPEQTERFLSRAKGIPCDGEFHIEFEKVEISSSHIADQRRDHGFSVPIAGQQLCLSRFSRAAESSPNVELERKQTNEPFTECALAADYTRSLRDRKFSVGR